MAGFDPTQPDLQLDVLLTPGAVSCAGVLSPGLLTDPNGINTCSGPKQVVTPGQACVAATPYSVCDSDYYCDTVPTSPTYQTCVYGNGAVPWIDPNCVVGGMLGFDLTIEAGCTDAAGVHIPVCNRGGATIPTGQVIVITQDNSGGGCNKACTGAASANCSYTLTAPLTAGSCINIPPAAGCTFGVGQACQQVNAGNTVIDVNGNKECNTTASAGWAVNGTGAGCSNNDAAINGTPASCTACAAPLSGSGGAPALSSWNVTYSCVPSE
jgi:hypothetical protein